jgi:hypothetical protein
MLLKAIVFQVIYYCYATLCIFGIRLIRIGFGKDHNLPFGKPFGSLDSKGEAGDTRADDQKIRL